MRILLTGATGYIGKRILPVLLHEGHEVFCCVRDKGRFNTNIPYSERAIPIEIDFLDVPEDLKLPEDIDVAYYLIHSMSSSIESFEEKEAVSAENFSRLVDEAGTEQVIYLGGIVNEETLSRHLQSRKNVEDILAKGNYHLTVLRAGIVIGSGSSSFEIIRDLVEKLPVMVTPRWVLTRTQPIAIRDIIECLNKSKLNEQVFGGTFDTGGPDVLSYKEMMLGYAGVRGLKRYIFTLPVMTPRLSSYWLYFVTAVPYYLAVNLVNSMKVEVLARDHKIHEILGTNPLSYKEAVDKAFQKTDQNMVLSSWKDTAGSSKLEGHLQDYIEVPSNGCFKDTRSVEVHAEHTAGILDNIWAIGGERGWYYGNWLWIIRGWLDKMAGGVGLRRGRTNPAEIHNGDSLDFWRVILADRKKKRLLLYAEMKLPGEAWLEFNISEENGKTIVNQVATFRPKGLWGRVYWYLVMPFHFFVFEGMLRNLVKYRPPLSENG